MANDEDLHHRIRAVLPHTETATEHALMVRRGPEGSERALDRPHVRPTDFTGRPMKGMVFVDPEGLRGPALKEWVNAAADHARNLPPKPPARPGRQRQ